MSQTNNSSSTPSNMSLGVVKVGSGLIITQEGVLSATGVRFFDVLLVDADYTATLENYYIGATKKDITITFPKGVLGKVYVVKNQSGDLVRVQGSLRETLDGTDHKTLAIEASLMAVFDGTRWNLI